MSEPGSFGGASKEARLIFMAVQVHFYKGAQVCPGPTSRNTLFSRNSSFTQSENRTVCAGA